MRWVSLTNNKIFNSAGSGLASANHGDTNTSPARRWSARTIDACSPEPILLDPHGQTVQ